MSSSSSSSTVGVDKATSDLLNGPDWTMNMEICDFINTGHWQAKDVVKALKKRLQHKNPKVQLLALTLLETMIKNCGDYVHFQIAERDILQEMIKIVKKKTDMHVRDKILVLLDSWQEAFGGPGGKYPQYYWAYEELRRYGVQFPQRSSNAAPIFTPPVTYPSLGHAQAGYGMPSNTSRRLDEAMASETETLSSSNIDSMRSVMDLLTDMLQALNPNDQKAAKDEVIIELVNQCRANQKKLVNMLSSTGDEELLGLGLVLNDSLQSLLAKHDALASGSPLPAEARDTKPTPTEERDSNSRPNGVRDSSPRPNEAKDYSPQPNVGPSTLISSVASYQVDDEEEEDDDFAQLARRRTITTLVPSQGTSAGNGEGSSLLNLSNGTTLSAEEALIPSPSNALVLSDPPAPVQTSTKEQDMIDLLSITLSTTSNSPDQPQTAPPSSDQSMHQVPVSHTPPTPSNQNMYQVPIAPSTQGYPYGFQPYTGNQGQVSYNNYVAPWVHPQPQPQPQLQPQYPQYSSNYPPPPWAANLTNSNQSQVSATASYMTMAPRANTASSNMSLPMARASQYNYSLPARDTNASTIQREAQATYTPRLAPPPSEQKPFVPSYRLFEDLNVLGSADKGLKRTGTMSPSLNSTSSQGMVGGRK
ncbi:TOM1-like protein 6 [Telopea speciosissima]|uniref:TOM1-like protein 6 n=1 Tax=Telopea speciosissima TaxID=54955 RepID=UPI001CC7A4C5|nr:TOM1-like protein 6 [Telopea speciosissima]